MMFVASFVADSRDVLQQIHRRGIQIHADPVHARVRRRLRGSASASSDPRRAGTGRRRWTRGSIFTSSASGSCRRRAIEIAPRTVTSRSGNSSRARLDAEYTDAPASFTTTTKTVQAVLLQPRCARTLRSPAKPFRCRSRSPRTLCFWTRSSRIFSAPSSPFSDRSRMDRLVLQKLSGLIDDCNLASCPDAGIDADDADRPRRRRQQQAFADSLQIP